MKIAVFEVNQLEQDYINNNVKGADFVFFEGQLNGELIEKVKDAEIVVNFIESSMNSKVISKFNKLKAIITMSTGYDHIDITTCQKRKIAVYNVPHYGENTVAEHAMALILALMKNIVKSVERTKHGNFSLEELEGLDLKGKLLELSEWEVLEAMLQEFLKDLK